MVNKLSKQLDTLKTERRALNEEKMVRGAAALSIRPSALTPLAPPCPQQGLKRQVTDLSSKVAKLCREKVQLESHLEMEEESVSTPRALGLRAWWVRSMHL